MTKGRLEAFSDGVFAIIITIMVLDLHIPRTTQLRSLLSVLPVFASYVLSFLYVGVYWNNHHHLLHATERVNGRILWANLHLLFWLSLAPFTTAWLGEDGVASGPVLVYGMVLLCSGIAYFILTRTLIQEHGIGSMLARQVGRDWKGRSSILIYVLALLLAAWVPRVACVLYVFVLFLWLLPDRRLERSVEKTDLRESS